VVQILVFQVNFVTLLDDLPKFLVVLLPEVLVALLLAQKGVDEFVAGPFEVPLHPLAFLQQLVPKADLLELDGVDVPGEFPPPLLPTHQLLEVLLVLPPLRFYL
jgi:hypothetical protein